MERKIIKSGMGFCWLLLTILEIIVGLNILFISYLLKLANVKINTSFNDFLDTQSKNNNSSYANGLSNGNN